MTLDQFAEMTRRIASSKSDEDFLPTLVVPERGILLVLDGMPVDRINEENVIHGLVLKPAMRPSTLSLIVHLQKKFTFSESRVM